MLVHGLFAKYNENKKDGNVEVSSSSPKIVSKDATATAAVAVKKKRKRTEDKWANFVSIPSLPKPDPISDNEMTEDDEAMNTEGVARIQVSKIRRELGERRTRNGEREKRRIAAAELKAKNVDIKLTRDDARREILDAIYEEDIHILNEAMDKGRRLGLEGETDEGQQWCAHEMRRGYRQIELSLKNFLQLKFHLLDKFHRIHLKFSHHHLL